MIKFANTAHSIGVGPLTRRKFIRFASTAAVTTATVKLIGCSSQNASDAGQGGGNLRILSWAGYDEPEIIGPFEEEHGVKVEFKTYVGGEQMLQFFNQSPPGTFDGIISDGEYVQKLVALDAIEPLNPDDFPQLKNYNAVYQDFPGFYENGELMAVGTRFGNYGIAFNKNYLSPEEVTSWDVLLRDDLRGKVGLFDWYLPNMGNASLAVFPDNPNPYELTDDQLQQVKDWMVRLKPNVSLITPNIQDITNAFINESIVAGPVGDWLIQNAIADGYDQFAAVVPTEGAIRWSEGAVVTSTSQNKDLALEWVKYMSQPETQARLAMAKAYKGIAPNTEAQQYLKEQEQQLLGYVPTKENAKQLVIESQLERTRARQLPVNQEEKVWQDLYNEFKTS